MKNLKKLAIILLVVLLGVTMVSNSVCATDWKSTTQFDSNNNDSLDSATRNIVGAIVSVIRIVGTGIALIMLVAVAIKYMSSAPGDRAEIKKHAVIYVVGAIVLFGGAQLIGIIQNFASNISA
ncbi:MAG: hypothetical protein OSJ66_04960 [Clostridia bacterium]|nr:hypothetical protein [Clostridia bacterium]